MRARKKKKQNMKTRFYNDQGLLRTTYLRRYQNNSIE